MDDGEVLVDDADPAKDLQAVELGHLQIKDEDVEPALLHPFNGTESIGKGFDRETVLWQKIGQKVEDLLFVVDNEYPRIGSRRTVHSFSPLNRFVS